ncbi:MAG: 30S ribosomal protein S27e [Candidatus Heimdallarchaeota archaeon]|nr:30S ribosomal protein S27e [Candidatus Heimdallarchaeota archaeon]
MSKPIIPRPQSKFLKVECPDCNKVQRVFNHANTEVRCLVCNCLLAKPSSGKCKIFGKIVDSEEKS